MLALCAVVLRKGLLFVYFACSQYRWLICQNVADVACHRTYWISRTMLLLTFSWKWAIQARLIGSAFYVHDSAKPKRISVLLSLFT